MTVAVDVTPLLGPRTGIGMFVAEAWSALSARPDDVRLVPYVLSGRADPADPALPAGTRRLPVPARIATAWWGRASWPRFDGPLRASAVVHGTNFVAPPRRRGVVLTIHDTTFVHRPDLCSPEVRAWTPAVRRALRRGAWVHTPSGYVADDVRATFGTERVRAVHHGVPSLPTIGPDEASADAAPYVLALGRLEPRKLHATLVEAFGAMAADDHDVRLVLAGPDGAARPAVDAAIAALDRPVRDRVEVVGWVDDARRASLLRSAAVLAYPSLDEGFGLPVLEAMAAGVPVVATDTGAVPEIAGDAAVLVGPTAEALAGGLDRALHDASLRARLVAEGTGRAALFSWDRAAAGLVDLYRAAADA